MEAQKEKVRPEEALSSFGAWKAGMPDVVGDALPAEEEIDPDAFDWEANARPSQRWPRGIWRVWLILAGRGFGKTRTGSEIVNQVANSNKVARIALVGETAADVRDVMVEGPDGILRRAHPKLRPDYEPSKRRLSWPNGCTATTYAGVDPEQLRGPQHGFAWVDELAKFACAQQTWDNLMFGLRMGDDPRCLVTTTPRPIPLIRALLRRDGMDLRLVRGSTYENRANLPEAFLTEILDRYEGTTLARQELYAELVDETPGAIWSRRVIDEHRVATAPKLAYTVVGVDPSAAAKGSGDACGIVVAGVAEGADPHVYVLADLTLNAGPHEWAAAVARACDAFGARYVVAEGNQGGDMVRQVLETADRRMPIRIVTATKSKAARAERIQVLDHRGLVHHVGALPRLEDEMVNWIPGQSSPNRIDALVWAVSRLIPATSGEVTAEVF